MEGDRGGPRPGTGATPPTPASDDLGEEGLSTSALRTLRALFGLLSPRDAGREREDAEKRAHEIARIPGLGPAELARLAARGVTTAADITPEPLMAIRGIDLGLVRGLLLFRASRPGPSPSIP